MLISAMSKVTQLHIYMYIYTHTFFFILLLSFFYFLFLFFCFLWPYLKHMEVPRQGVKLELQLPATAMPDLSLVCNLHHSLQQCWIPDPLSEVRAQTHILMDSSWIYFHCTTAVAPFIFFSIMVYHRILKIVPCAIQHNLIYSSYV